MNKRDPFTPRFRLRTVVERQVLRQVMMPGLTAIYEFEVDVLDCGHALSTARDLYGYTYPGRRRCFECMGGGPALGTLMPAQGSTEGPQPPKDAES